MIKKAHFRFFLAPWNEAANSIEQKKKMNSIIVMIDNDDFSIISQAVVITNMMNIDNELELNENLEDGIGDENDEEVPFDNNVQVPSTFTDMEGTNLNIDDNWIDKEELFRAIKIHCIRTHRQFEVIDSRPTIWTLRCKLYLQTGCKWKLHASKNKHNGYFEITTSIGLYTFLHYKLSQDHPNLDASLIAMETRHLIKAQPSISIPALRAEIVETLDYTPSYKKVWVGKQKAIEHVFGISEESYVALPKYLGALQKYRLRHVINNFYDKFRNSKLKALAYRAESQNQIRKFNSIMEEIGKLNPHGRHWLESRSLNRWTLAHDGGMRYGLLITNLLEIFNSVRRPLGSSSQANEDAYTPHVVSKQVALMNYYGIKKIVFVQQDYKMVLILKNEEMSFFVEFVGNRVIIKNNIRLSKGKYLLLVQV
uniref:Transposase MuDR plant domain-containing protein n=1 Tax=Lactuca sativa TaxID=4236 RepID=A0A9R1UVU9_LACSA|nr:hypothetical protein LSAT_V11C800443500 [Lactuca sativa]